MNFRFNGILEIDRDILQDDLISDEEKGAYLLSLHTDSWSTELVMKLIKLGHVNAIDSEELSVRSSKTQSEKKVFSKEGVLSFQEVSCSLVASGGVLFEDFFTRGPARITCISLGDLFNLLKRSLGRDQVITNSVSSVDQTPLKTIFESNYMNTITRGPMLNIVITKTTPRAHNLSRAFSGSLSHDAFGLVQETEAERLRRKLKNLISKNKAMETRKIRSEKVPIILSKIHGAFIDYRMEEAVGDFTKWRNNQNKAIRKALRDRPTIELQTWLDAIDWFSEHTFWRSHFFSRGFSAIDRHLPQFLSTRAGFATKKTKVNINILE